MRITPDITTINGINTAFDLSSNTDAAPLIKAEINMNKPPNSNTSIQVPVEPLFLLLSFAKTNHKAPISIKNIPIALIM